MHSNVVQMPLADSMVETSIKAINYEQAEQQFVTLLELDDLDEKLSKQPELATDFEQVLSQAIKLAYQENSGAVSEDKLLANDAANRFIQRVLYRINRLNLFWYDDLRNYTNERSFYLQKIRNQIESVWQAWELTQIDVAAIEKLDVKQALIERAAFDVDPPLSEGARYIREEMSAAGYRHLLAIASFDGLVEASRLSRILGGAANEVQCTLTRVLMEEYGSGRFNRKHSTFFAQMLQELGMHTQPEAYFDLVPWEVLASINHNFLLTECKRYFLRYNGGLAYFEVAGPAVYQNYLTAAQRLGLSPAAMGYWELHIKEDERHGRWMIDDVALPLADMYSVSASELVLGYDQEKWMSDRAATAVVRAIRNAESH